jgi:nicotinamidase-related amidase
MPATALDPKTALVVIDLQKGISAYPTVHPFAEVVANARRLAEAFRRVQLPVVLVNVSPPSARDASRPAATHARTGRGATYFGRERSQPRTLSSAQ